MSTVFADTFHLLALLNQDDPAHHRALEHQRQPWGRMVLTDCVLLELGDALCRPDDHADFLTLQASLRAPPRVRIVPLTTALLERGIQRLRDRPDKDWPLTDCIAFVVMEDLGITQALTGDRHFEQAGFTALLKEP